MAPRGTTVLGVCVNIGSMLAPSFRGFLATNLLTRGVLMRHEDASADPRMLVKGWIAQSVTLRWLTRNFRVPGDGFDRHGAQTHWHRSRSGSTRSMSSVPTFASFFPTCMIMIEVSITGARGDEQRQFASHPCPAL
jgi:hypothetical protein